MPHWWPLWWGRMQSQKICSWQEVERMVSLKVRTYSGEPWVSKKFSKWRPCGIWMEFCTLVGITPYIRTNWKLGSLDEENLGTEVNSKLIAACHHLFANKANWVLGCVRKQNMFISLLPEVVRQHRQNVLLALFWQKTGRIISELTQRARTI